MPANQSRVKSLELGVKKHLSTLNPNLTAHNPSRGFTLVELLVAIAIVAVLAAVSMVIFSGIQAKGRDAARISDMSNIQQAIILSTSNSESLPQDLCHNIPSPCQANSFPIDAATLKTDGTGWVKINFDAKNTANFTNIPIDPINDSTYNYTYEFDDTNWKITAVFESEDYKPKMIKDGGSDPNRYEVFSKYNSP